MSVTDVLGLFSGVALFLFGMTLMGDSLKKVAGNSLELVLYKLSSSPIKGILLGTGVTAAIQSSSATSVMVVGFVNSGMMKVKQAIGVIMGAIIGTSITGWIISLSSLEGSSGILKLLSTETLTAIIAIIGIILRMFSKHSKQRNIGDIMMGFAVLMFGMKAMSNSVAGLRESQTFIDLLVGFSNPIIGILVGAGFTALIQSASASVGILQALSATGVIKFSVALPIIMGIAIGASLPVILSALGATADGKRTAWSYLIIDVIGVIIVSLIFYPINAIKPFAFSDSVLNTFSIALVNTLFRVFAVILMAPFISLIEKLVVKLIKGDESEDDRFTEDKLEERFIAHPALAIEQCRLTVNSMAEVSRDSIYKACALLNDYSEKGFNSVSKKEEVVDRYEDKLGTYLVKVTRKEMTKKQNQEASKYLHVITDLERISDHAKNIAEAAKEKDEKKIVFTNSAENEMNTLAVAVQDILTLTIESFINEDLSLAFKIEPFEQLIDDICDKMKNNHIDRVSSGECTLEHGFVFNDLLTDFERISDHCSNIALAVIETEKGEFNSHSYESEIRMSHSHNYDEIYKYYSDKYNINK